MTTSTHPAHVPHTARRSAPLRLTRRGRLVVVLALFTLLLLAFSLGRGASAGAGSAAPAARPTVVVAPGETLWAIARRIAPGVDPRTTVARLTELNGLRGRAVQSGQRLTLPR